MTPFLKQIATIFYDRYGAELQRLAFVFPNRRSGIFFHKYLSEVSSKQMSSPTILTINDLFCELSTMQPADPVKLLFQLYNIYLQKSGKADSFDDFFYWGKMLLNDFDDIDKYLTDAKQLFTNVKDLNNIDNDYSYLNPSQVEAIRSFWSSFHPANAATNSQRFLNIWEQLYPIYSDLRKTLAAEGLGFEGMIYREVVENLEKTSVTFPYEKIVFIGLNALTNVEKALLKHLNKQGIADFYWDYASEKIKDPDNRASFFMQENLNLFPSAYPLPDEETVDTQFEIIGIPSRIGQAKQLYPILEQIFNPKTTTPSDAISSPDDAIKTAIVLPDEQLLLPTLHSIPAMITRINVTLGYSLTGTPVASLMDNLRSLHKNKRITERHSFFFHRDVEAILCHQYILSVCPDEAPSLLQNIKRRNQAYISEQVLSLNPLFRLLFSVPSNVLELSDYLTAVLNSFTVVNDTSLAENETDSTTDSVMMNTHDLDQEFVYHYNTIINRIKELIETTHTSMSSDTYFKLLKQMTETIKIPFIGEPLSGLQVMGALETRVLDFDNLIILSVNEGVFPNKNADSSFIPYHLRRGFGLPTPEHRESVWAYHFYRMIHRAKCVIMLYDTRSDGLQSGEVSRFVHQLRYHYKAPIRQKVTVYNVAASIIRPFKVDKDVAVMRALARYETEKSFSASAINTYLDCPLKFYFTAIKGIDEEKAISAMLQHDTFGTLLHRVMELAYKPFCGTTITSDLITFFSQEKLMTELIQTAFAKDYFHSNEPSPLAGQAYLYGETIRKYVNKILDYDRSLTPFIYIGSERLFQRTLEIAGGRKIRIKGFIDRIDCVNGTTRIIDYKSGKPSALTFASMESLFDKTEKDRKKAIMQVFLYAWVYTLETGEQKIQPTVYYTRDFFKQSAFDFAIRQIIEKEKIAINHFEDEAPLFEDNLRACLDELFNANIPFTQTKVEKNCALCPFKTICK